MAAALNKPRLVVFDLDATLWGPELYLVEKQHGPSAIPGDHVRLLESAVRVLEDQLDDTQLVAVASRTGKTEWAHVLLRSFTVKGKSLEALCGGLDSGRICIFKGDKKEHFARLKKATGFEYSEMIFFDDALNGTYGNCESVAQLGVTAVHTPQGLTYERWMSGMAAFGDGSRSVVLADVVVAGRNNRKKAPKASVTLPSVTLPCVSLAMPFAALVLNGVKTLETRPSSACFGPLSGKSVLIRIGHNDWDDGGAWMTIVDKKFGELPTGFQRGMVAGVVAVGATAALSGREDAVEQRSCLKRDALPGKHGTELTGAAYLKRGFFSKGQPGNYDLEIPPDIIPEHHLKDHHHKAAGAPPQVPAPQPTLNRKARRAAALAARPQD